MTKTRRNKKKYNATKKKYTYNKSEYNSGDGMLTTVWGPAMWHYLHTMSFNYPTNPTLEEKKHYRDFIISLQYVLPCKYCRINLTNNFNKKTLKICHMLNRYTCSHYIYDLHETVNKMLNKKSTLSYCDIRERYEHFRARCTDEKPKLFKFNEAPQTDTKEKGCTEPLNGKKSKCVINIVPQEDKTNTFKMDKKCIKKRVHQ